MSDVSDASSQGSKTKEDNEFLMALENFNHGVAEKWGDVLRLFNCGGEEKKKEDNNLILSSESHFNLSELASSSSSSTTSDSIHSRSSIRPSTTTGVATNPIQKSKQDTEDFIREVSPIIADLTEMIEEFNMNDPSRV